jgi:uncharacterized protein affecting Mg2+/Co2+ transport
MTWRIIALVAALGLLLTACPEQEEVAEEPAEDQADEPGDEEVEPGAPDEDFGGDWFNVIAMAHTSPVTPQGWDVPLETTPWDGQSEGTFSYSSIACADDAPINNISTNLTTLNTRLPESRSPASTRLHPIEFEVADWQNGAGSIEGTVTMVACQLRAGLTPEDEEVPDEEKDRIVFSFTGDVERTAAEEIRYTGTFEITDATGQYEGMTGEGQIGGYIMCLGPDDCADFGEFRDIQVAMVGTYDHPDLDELREEDPGFEGAPDDGDEADTQDLEDDVEDDPDDDADAAEDEEAVEDDEDEDV